MSERQRHLTREDALQALTSSGYLLESRVESLLRRNGYRVETNRMIPDDTAEKLREVDLWARSTMAFTSGPDNEIGIGIELVVECVHPPQPVAFITKAHPDPVLERTDFWYALKLVGNPQDEGVSPHNTWNWLASDLALEECHHYRAKRISTQYCSFQKKREKGEWMALHRNEEHEAIHKLCLATDYYIRDLVVSNYSHSAGWDLSIVYPVLIVEAPIFEVRPTQRSARIVSTRHVQYRCEQAIRGETQEYHIDVISESYLQRYVSMLERELSTIAQRLDDSYGELCELWETRQRNREKLHRLDDA